MLQGALLLRPSSHPLQRRCRFDKRKWQLCHLTPPACLLSQAALAKSGYEAANYYSAAVTPKSWLWTACIDAAMKA